MNVLRRSSPLAAALLVVSLQSHAANLTGDGYIYLTQPGTAWSPPSGVTNNNRLIWYPDAGSFRFGDLSSSGSTYWNASNIGAYSFAAGYDVRATGAGSFAFGESTSALGASSIAMGWYSQAQGEWSIAIGNETVAAAYSTALGNYSQATGSSSGALFSGSATGAGSIAIGLAAWASGDWSLAMSTIDPAYSTGNMAIVIGNYSFGSGNSSLVVGNDASALADNSTAIGMSAYTSSQYSVALGSKTLSTRMNGTNASPSSPQADDPVLMVGNGDLDPWSTPPTRNALTIYRNGASHFDGIVRVKPAGDIPMGGYTAKPSGVQYP